MDIPANPISSPIPAKGPNKKVVIGAAVALGVVTIFALISVLVSSLTHKEEVSTGPASKGSVNSSPQSTQNTGSFKNVPTTDKIKSYKSSLYNIDYPANWKAEEVSFQNEGTGISLYPLNKSSNNPSLLLVKINDSPIVIQQKEDYFVSQGFVGSNVLVDNLHAKSLKGAIGTVQVTHIYFSRQESNYLLKYTYVGKVVDPELEAIFAKMISSFEFN